MGGEREAPGAKISLSQTALAALRELWANRALSDITLCLHVPGKPPKTYALHRTVICAAGYFQSLVNQDWDHTRTGDLKPDDPLFGFQAFEAVVRGLYGFEVDVSKENVLNLLAVGSYLQVDEICDDCKTFLLDELDRMSLAEVAQCMTTVCCRNYPCSEEIKAKSIGLLSMHAWQEARDVLLCLPPVILEELLRLNSLWVPDEASRVDLILELLNQASDFSSSEDTLCDRFSIKEHSETCTTVDPCSPDFHDPTNPSLSTSLALGAFSKDSENCDVINRLASIEIPSSGSFSPRCQSETSATGALRESLLQVLRTGIHYAFIPDNQLFAVQKKLTALGDEPTLKSLQTDMWTRGMFYGTLQEIQNGEDVPGGTVNQIQKRPWSGAWLRFGVEFKEVEQMAAKQQQDSEKVYYAGFMWWVKLRYKERDESEDVYNAYVCVCNCKPMGGCYVDQGGRGIVDVDASVKDRSLSLGNFQFNTLKFAWGDGRGWAIFKRSNLQSFLTASGTIRIAVALRLAE